MVNEHCVTRHTRYGATMRQRSTGHTTYRCVMSDATTPVSFSALIRDGRRRKGISQEELVKRSGVSRSTVSRWERGLADNPEPEQVRAVCRVLGVDPRAAAVALGYLTWDEIGGEPQKPALDPVTEQVLQSLEDPGITDEDRHSLMRYLQFLRSERHRQAN